MSQELTRRQLEVLNMIGAFDAQHGRPPTRKEIADHFGFASWNAAQVHVEALQRKGALIWTRRKARGIKLAPQTFGGKAA